MKLFFFLFQMLHVIAYLSLKLDDLSWFLTVIGSFENICICVTA